MLYKKAILINFAKFTEKELYRSLFFDKDFVLKYLKKDSQTTAARLFLRNTLYSLHRPQPENVTLDLGYSTAQKMKFPIKDFLSKCDQIHRKLLIWSHLLKKSLMKNFTLVQWLFKKLCKVRQRHPKSLISVLVCFWSTNAKNLFLQGRLGTGLGPHAVSDFPGHFLIS